MQVFTRVVEAGSFAAAAGRLGLSRAAASKQVMQLEEHLGTRLLNRTTRRLALTEEGAQYYERCLGILGAIEEAEREAADARGEPRGTLRLSAPVSFGTLHLGPAVNEFVARHPKLNVALTLDDRYVDLVEEGFDAAIRIGRLADSSLVARRLCSVGLVVAASPEYWRRHGRPTQPSELAQHACLNYTLRTDGRDWRFRDAAGEEQSVAVSGPITTNNGDLLRLAALAGVGVAWLPDFIIGADVKAGRLETALDDWRLPAAGVHIVYPQTRHVSPKLRAFVDFLARSFTGAPSWRLGK
jgi:DNA-binding transcriptional LysR family regulator